jgi:restriction system protein
MKKFLFFILSLVFGFFLSLLVFALLVPEDYLGFVLLAFPAITYFLYRFFVKFGLLQERAFKQLESELNDLMFEETSLVATAYRSTVSTNSFGKKDYSKFKRELIEHLLDNTESEDVLTYARYRTGDIDIPVETIYKIEQVINDYSKSEGFDDEMDPYEYEHFCANQFLKNDWDDAEATAGSSDQGVDVIAKRGDDVLVAQCKKYQKPVNNTAVQEVVAGMGYYGANIGVVISNAGYTNSAKKLAEANNIKLIHHAEIKNL